MKDADPFASWRRNPFFVLGAPIEASRSEVERAGQRLLGLMALGSATARICDTPLGPATRDEDDVRQALATLRDPNERTVHELLANVAPSARTGARESPAGAWTAAEHALGWIGKWPR